MRGVVEHELGCWDSLGNKVRVVDVAWNPSGARLAALCVSVLLADGVGGGMLKATLTLWVVNAADGTLERTVPLGDFRHRRPDDTDDRDEETQLFGDHDEAWATLGNYLGHHQWDGVIGVMYSKAKSKSLAWSASGKKLVASCNFCVYVVDAPGGVIEHEVYQDCFVGLVAWSLCGTKVTISEAAPEATPAAEPQEAAPRPGATKWYEAPLPLAPPVVRKEIRAMSAEEQERYANAIDKMMASEDGVPGSSQFFRLASYHGGP